MVRQFTPTTLLQLRGYARNTDAVILVANPFEFIMVAETLDDAKAAVVKFSNAALAVIGYGEVATQVKFTPR